MGEMTSPEVAMYCGDLKGFWKYILPGHPMKMRSLRAGGKMVDTSGRYSSVMAHNGLQRILTSCIGLR